MKIYSLLCLMLIFAGSLAHSCGTLYVGPQYQHSSMAISPNGAYLATTDVDTRVSMLKLSNGALSDLISYSFPEFPAMYPVSVAFSPDSSLLAVVVHQQSSWNGNIAVFNVSGGQLNNPILYDLPSPSYYPLCLAFSPNGAYLAIGNLYPGKVQENAVTIFNVAGGGTLTSPVSYLSPSQEGPGYVISPTSISFSPDGSLLATANFIGNSDTGNISLFNVNGQGVLDAGTTYALPAGSSAPYSIAFSPNGSLLATVHPTSNSVTLYAVSQGILKTGTSYTLPPSASGQSLSFAPNGSLLATTNVAVDGVTVFDITNVLSNGTSYGLNGTITYQSPESVAFSPDGAFLFVANSYYSITIFNTAAWCTNDTMP